MCFNKMHCMQCNAVPDVLSRSYPVESPVVLLHTAAKSGFNPVTYDLPMDLSQIAAEQKLDPECQELMVKLENQKTTDIKRTHYVLKNIVLFRSVPDFKLSFL